MRTNNLLTYVLYALLALLIVIAGYKACEMKKAQALQEKENAEFQQQMRDMGYTEEDTTASSGSSYVAETETKTSAATDKSGKKAAANNNGIEGEEETPSTASTAAKTQKTSPTATKPVTSSTESKPKTGTSTTSTAPSKPSLTAKGGSTAGSTGKYMVITGAFKDISNARDEMEILIKMGYTNAEVRSLKKGWQHVIASRTNSKDAAGKLADKLRSQGFDGAYVK